MANELKTELFKCFNMIDSHEEEIKLCKDKMLQGVVITEMILQKNIKEFKNIISSTPNITFKKFLSIINKKGFFLLVDPDFDSRPHSLTLKRRIYADELKNFPDCYTQLYNLRDILYANDSRKKYFAENYHSIFHDIALERGADDIYFIFDNYNYRYSTLEYGVNIELTENEFAFLSKFGIDFSSR